MKKPLSSSTLIKLHRPQEFLAPSYFEFIEEMRMNGERIWEGFLPSSGETTLQFVERLLLAETKPEGGRVPETTYWASDGTCVVGRISLRHCLNENLSEFGGHIGYEVRPSFRKRRIAKDMLALVIQTPKALEIGDLLLTCAPDNIASNKTIVANGGKLTRTAFVEKWRRDTNSYFGSTCGNPQADPK